MSSGELSKVSMGNAAGEPDFRRLMRPASPVPRQPQPADHALDPAAYLAPGSDQVALLVLTHQAQMHNLITLTNYQTRLALYALTKDPAANPVKVSDTEGATALDALPETTQARIRKPADQLVRFLLFAERNSVGPGCEEGHRSFVLCAGVRRPRGARLSGPFAARLRPA